jgi:hypothetical protein
VIGSIVVLASNAPYTQLRARLIMRRTAAQRHRGGRQLRLTLGRRHLERDPKTERHIRAHGEIAAGGEIRQDELSPQLAPDVAMPDPTPDTRPEQDAGHASIRV